MADPREGGEIFFDEKIIFHLLTHLFDANKFKNFFGAKFFDSEGVLPGEKCAQPSIVCALVCVCLCVCVCVCVCVRVGVLVNVNVLARAEIRVCQRERRERERERVVSASQPTMPEVLQELLAMQKYFDECCYQLFGPKKK